MNESVPFVVDKGIDAGKEFMFSRMGMVTGDKWANQVKLELVKSGISVAGMMDIVDGKAVFTGLSDIMFVIDVALRALAGVDSDRAQELLDQLNSYIHVKLPSGGTRPIIIGDVNSDIEDPHTLWDLRLEAIKANGRFLTAGVIRD